MKRKLDFVTNSSSSSFIVAWPNQIEFYEDVKEVVLFTEKADIVYKDSMNQKPFIIEDSQACINKIAKKVVSGYFDGWYEYDDCPEYKEIMRRRYKTKDISDDEYRKGIDKAYKIIERENLKRAKKIAKKFVMENLGKYAYIYEYADGDGRIFQELEHGDTFSYLNNLRISHH